MRKFFFFLLWLFITTCLWLGFTFLNNMAQVARSCVNCKVTPSLAPLPSPADADGQFCGGIAGIQCPEGFSCQLDGNYPDAGGKCVVE